MKTSAILTTLNRSGKTSVVIRTAAWSHLGARIVCVRVLLVFGDSRGPTCVSTTVRRRPTAVRLPSTHSI